MQNLEGRTHGNAPETPLPSVPPPPSPSADTGIISRDEEYASDSAALPAADIHDVFDLKPMEALKMLCKLIERLAKITGDLPPTPPIAQPSMPQLRAISPEKENAVPRLAPDNHQQTPASAEDDGVPLKAKTPIGSPEAHPTEPLHLVGANTALPQIQHGAIARKFNSKKPPPITLEEYLLRLHKFCPMSTAVYLATSLYIYRLSMIEKTVPVTPRNAHRLVLAGLRVAMKALEDQSYPHGRFAKVGGVSKQELGRLEICFCFVIDFELKVSKEILLEHTKAIRGDIISYRVPVEFQPELPLPK